jgi:uncharacterized membrane protein YgcG
VNGVELILHAPRTARAAVALTAALAALVIAVSAPPSPARAERPMRLDEQLTDEVDALGDRRDEAEDALRELREDTALQLFVVFVRSFDGTPAQEWAETTAGRSDLGDRDGLLAVATGDRAYAYSFDESYPLTDAQLAEVAEVAIEPALAANDWAGAVVAAADGYRAVLAGRPVPEPRIVPGEPDPGGGGVGVGALLCPLLVLAGLAGAALLWWRSRGRRRRAGAPAPAGGPVGGLAGAVAPGAPGEAAPAAGPVDPLAALSTDELSNRANGLLVQADDDLLASERELSLATAEYGAEATADFRAALETARRDVAEAFRLRLALDDLPPDDEAGRRAALAEIIRRCEAADERLDAQSADFEELRDVAGRIEQVLPELHRRRAAAQDRVPAAEMALTAIGGRYTGPAVTAVAANVEQARERLAFVGAALDRADAAVAEDDRPEAALAARAAEEAADQAEQLLEAVARAAQDLDAARAGVDALLDEVEADLAAARAALEAAGGSAAALAAAVGRAEQTLSSVRAELAQPKTDPPAAVHRLQEADAELDRALADVRDAGERSERARALLAQALPVARAEVAAATDFIATRRGAVGGQARTWLAEAQRHLARAEELATPDPAQALPAAQEAHRLATYAAQAARDDVERWAPPGGFAGAGADPLGAFTGALLGGILSGGMRGGGWGGGAWGGGGWGGGGFGGSRSRGRRMGGGGFGGGGRRGGGGRF